MTTRDRDEAACRNDGCPRRAEPGEEYCPSCRLESCLFHRERRWSEPAPGREELPGGRR